MIKVREVCENALHLDRPYCQQGDDCTAPALFYLLTDHGYELLCYGCAMDIGPTLPEPDALIPYRKSGQVSRIY